MTQRKPGNLDWASWIDLQITEAQERGEFDNLKGAGQPIPGIDEPYDEMRWVNQLLIREGAVVLPPALALRKAREEALAVIDHAMSEAFVREIVENLNDRIRQANRMPTTGPPTTLMPLDVDEIVTRWRATRTPTPD